MEFMWTYIIIRYHLGEKYKWPYMDRAIKTLTKVLLVWDKLAREINNCQLSQKYAGLNGALPSNLVNNVWLRTHLQPIRTKLQIQSKS